MVKFSLTRTILRTIPFVLNPNHFIAMAMHQVIDQSKLRAMGLV
jgi:hypothetical protein